MSSVVYVAAFVAGYAVAQIEDAVGAITRARREARRAVDAARKRAAGDTRVNLAARTPR